MTPESADALPEGVHARKITSRGRVDYLDAEGKLHRTDGPARVYPDPSTYWLITGKNPKKTRYPCGQQEWHRHGMLHREGNLPAITNPKGTEIYAVDGQWHRTNGPALIEPSGYRGFFLHGNFLTEDEFLHEYPAVEDQP